MQQQASHYQPRSPIKLTSLDVTVRPHTFKSFFLTWSLTLDRHIPASHELSNQPKVKSSAHQMVGFPSTSALTVNDVKSVKLESTIGVSEQFSVSWQAGILIVCWASHLVSDLDRSYLNPMKVIEQGAPLDSQPKLPPVKLNEKQEACFCTPTPISAISECSSTDMLEMDEGIYRIINSPEDALKEFGGGSRTVKPSEYQMR